MILKSSSFLNFIKLAREVNLISIELEGQRLYKTIYLPVKNTLSKFRKKFNIKRVNSKFWLIKTQLANMCRAYHKKHHRFNSFKIRPHNMIIHKIKSMNKLLKIHNKFKLDNRIKTSQR